MPSFEEEALARAQQLSHARAKAQPREQKQETPEKTRSEIPAPVDKPKPPKPQQDTPEGGMLDIFFKDKERSVILMLLLLLMDEKTDPGLLVALVYLLT